LTEETPPEPIPSTVGEVRRDSGIPTMPGTTAVALDYTERTSFKAFHQSGIYSFGTSGYGTVITDTNRYFYSTREPVGVWWVKGIAYDLWDNWFRIEDVDDPDSDELDKQVQKALRKLNAKVQLPRETIFERRYGTALLLLSYSGFSKNSWKDPLYELDEYGFPPEKLSGGVEILQITPYPWTSVSVIEVDENPSSIRYGLPVMYSVNTGAAQTSEGSSSLSSTAREIEVHWTRTILDAPRIDEHSYLGESAMDCIFDDLIGGRNMRWSAYEAFYRYGSGFPVIKTNATAAQNRAWVDSGALDDYLHVYGYFVMGQDEDFRFAGAEGKTLNPNTYADMYFTFIAAATGVAKDTIKGVSAGRVTGSEVNERQYYKNISLHQHLKDPFLEILVQKLIQTGQVEHDGDFAVDWIDPFEVNPQDKAAMEFMNARTQALQTFRTINEVRELNGLDPIDGGDVLMLQPGQMAGGAGEPAPNQEEPAPVETEPEEGTPNNATLLDRVLQM